MNEPKPRDYEDWLAFTDEQRETALFSWNSSKREMIGFPLIAAGRLALMSDVPVLDVRIGIYHGGEYVLHFYIDDIDVIDLPQMLKQTFEGFRVIWLPVSKLTG